MASEAHVSNDVPQQQHDLKLYIPNTMKDWPWQREICPFEDEATAESIAWASQFQTFTHRGLDYTEVLLKTGCGAEGVKFFYCLY